MRGLQRRALPSRHGGTPQIFVRPFPALDRKWLVSTGQGDTPHGRADSREVGSSDKKSIRLILDWAASMKAVGPQRSVLASNAGIDYTWCMQYTLRGIPERLDTILRERARTEGKSLNTIALDVLADGLGVGRERTVHRDLSDIAGTWKKDAEADAALAAHDRIDSRLWK